jgi:hypothetical protein
MDKTTSGEMGEEGNGVNLRVIEGDRQGPGGSMENEGSAADKPGLRRLLAFDPVNRPSHYANGSVECIDAIRAQLSPEEWRGFLRGQVAKYNWRMTKKGSEKQDAEKLHFYASLLAGKDPRRGR